MTYTAHPIDIGIFIVFLVITLIVGISYGRSIKTIQDYALGGKNFSTFTLTATIVATWMGGDAIFYIVTNVYKGGLYFIIPILGWAVCIILTGQLAARMGEFLNNVSVAEAMRDMYGRSAHIITAAFGILSCIGCIAIQLKVTAMVITLMWGFTGLWVSVVAGIIVITYSALGGIKSVTYTDVFQFLTFGTLIPIIALVIWNNLKTPSMVLDTLAHTSILSPTEVVGWNSKFMGAIALLAFFVIPSMDPAIFQRVAMGRNVKQTKRAFIYAAIPFLLILLFMIWISILLLSTDGSLPPDALVSYIVHQYAYPGLRGLFGTGIVAMAMSTSDSYINASAVLLSNDIAKPLNISTQNPVRTARLFAVMGGGVALMLAINTEDLSELALLPGSFYMPVVTVPLVMAIFGFRSTTRAALIGMILGFTTALIWKIFLDYTEINSIAPGMLANLIGLMGSHYLLGEQGGWQKIELDSPLALERKARKQAWQWRLQTIRNFRLYPYLKQNLPTQESFYFFFGLYTMAATYAAFYAIGDEGRKDYLPIYTGIYYLVLPITTAFLTLPIWSDRIKKSRFTVYAWPIGIGTIFFFAGTLLAIISGFNHMQVMVMMIHLLMAVLLLHWPLALSIACSGTALAIAVFTRYTGKPLPLSTLDSLQMIYLLVLFTGLIIALKGRQAYRGLVASYQHLFEEKSFVSQVLLASLSYRTRLQQEARSYDLKALERSVQLSEQSHTLNHSPHTKTQLIAENAALQQYAYKLDLLNKHLQQILEQAQNPMPLSVDTVALKDLLGQVLGAFYQQKKTVRVINQLDTQCKTWQVDVGKLKKLLISGLYYAFEQQQKHHPLLLGLQDTQLAYPIMAIPDYVKQIKAVRITITTHSSLPKLKPMYLGSVDTSATRFPQDTSELPILYNQQIVEAHYGDTEFIEHETGSTQLYVIPVDVREVRPPNMDQWKKLNPTENHAEKRHPLESDFVSSTQAKTNTDRAMLQTALRLIKQYHGERIPTTAEPAYLHPIAVAQILLDYTHDTDALLAALLHDSIDNTRLSLNQISLLFNPVVQRIVDGVASVDSRLKSFKRIQLSNHEKVRKLLEIKDERVLYVQLADRLHHMRTIEVHPSLVKQKKIAEETLQFFVPVAKRLDLKPIAEELQERSFAVLNKG